MENFKSLLFLLVVAFVIFGFIYNFAVMLTNFTPIFAVSITLGIVGSYLFAIAPKHDDKHPLFVTSVVLIILSVLFLLIDIFSK